MLTAARLILSKDLRIERRSREMVFTVLSFSLLATVVFALGFYIDAYTARAFGPGIIWVVVLFAGTLGLQRLFEPERENDCLGGLLLSPMDPRGIYLGKLGVQLTMMSLMLSVTLPTIFLFFDMFPLLDGERGGLLLAVVGLGTLGFSVVGTLFAAMLLNSRLREVLLPVVVYPLVAPVLIAGVQSTRTLLDGSAEIGTWLTLLGAFDLIYLGVALAIFPKMVRE